MTATLVRPLFDGPLDIVGDVHGEIEALRLLLQRIGYRDDGFHSEGRRLVFVGDLVDRGPDSPAVLDWVRRLVANEQAQCVLGNHELNILLGRRKPDNIWFFHHDPPHPQPLSPHRGERGAKHSPLPPVGGEGLGVRGAGLPPQVWIEPNRRASILDFFADLPLALERPDVRVIHACWDEAMIALARQTHHTEELYRKHEARIEEELHHRGLTGPFATLARQNDNPVKLLTSGPEARADEPFEAMGQVRHERRVAWWRDYREPLCLFGHYWRILLPHEVDGDRLFAGMPLDATLGCGAAMCIDYSVGKRFLERAAPDFAGVFQTRLAALRLPERVLLFDNGEQVPLI